MTTQANGIPDEETRSDVAGAKNDVDRMNLGVAFPSSMYWVFISEMGGKEADDVR